VPPKWPIPSPATATESNQSFNQQATPNQIIQFALAFALTMIIIIIMTTLIINITTLAGGINSDKVVVVLARRNSLSEFCDWSMKVPATRNVQFNQLN